MNIDSLKPLRKIDLVGFTYGDYHSSQFGLVRVSSGNRYSEYLSPTLKNTTVDVSGMDGALYFGTNKGQRAFSINMAFDNVKEVDIRNMKEWLSSGPKPLIFDERPYVEYICVVNSAPQIQYLMFDEEGERVYKGELSVSFVSYLSYGLSVEGKKFAEDYLEENFDEWADTSDIPFRKFIDSENKTHEYDKVEAGAMYVYNAGDSETDYELTLFVDGASAKIALGEKNYTFTMPTKTEGGNAFRVRINSKLQFAYAEEVKIADGAVSVLKEKVLLIPDGEKELFRLPRGRSKIALDVSTYASMTTITYRYRYV